VLASASLASRLVAAIQERSSVAEFHGVMAGVHTGGDLGPCWRAPVVPLGAPGALLLIQHVWYKARAF